MFAGLLLLAFVAKRLRDVTLSREHPGKPLEVAVIERAHLHPVVGLDDYDLGALVEPKLTTQRGGNDDLSLLGDGRRMHGNGLSCVLHTISVIHFLPCISVLPQFKPHPPAIDLPGAVPLSGTRSRTRRAIPWPRC